MSDLAKASGGNPSRLFVKPICSWNSKTRAVIGWFPGVFGSTLCGNVSYLQPALTREVLCRSEEQAMTAWSNAKPTEMRGQAWINQMCGYQTVDEINRLQLFRT